MIHTRHIGLAFLFVLGGASMTLADSINEKVVTFLKLKLGTRVGGGECAHAVSEALRVSGAAFAGSDLGPDNPDQGDYVWGTLIKVVSSNEDNIKDSDPSARIQPGDVLQFHGTKFITVTQTGNVTRTRTTTAEHHTAVAAKVDAEGRYPTEVYEQNAPSRDEADARDVVLNSIDFSSFRSGWVRIYRPKARVDMPGKYVASLVNNTPKEQTATIRFEGSAVSKLSLTPVNTADSYTLPSLETSSTTLHFLIVLDNGASVTVQNAAGYEIFTNPNGETAIRKLIH